MDNVMVGVVDKAILGGTLVRPGRTPVQGNVGIRDGRIAAVTDPGFQLDAAETFDATGAYVFPGVIEPHAHWGLGDGLGDLRTESRSSAYGGVTTTLFSCARTNPTTLCTGRWLSRGRSSPSSTLVSMRF